MRRFAILALAFVLSLNALAQAATPAPPQAQPPAAPAAPTPIELWGALMAGNKSFAAGKISFDTLKEERLGMREHQSPPVTVLACSDSRVPPELVFNQSLGALFVIRTAGNVADDFGLASVDFAVLNGYTRLLIVLGHENCGAVKAALTIADPPTQTLLDLTTRIRMSFIGIPYDWRDPANFRRATEMNARASAAHLLAASKVLREAVAMGNVRVVPAFYEMSTGEVKALP